jgi:hypothetical protein
MRFQRPEWCLPGPEPIPLEPRERKGELWSGDHGLFTRDTRVAAPAELEQGRMKQKGRILAALLAHEAQEIIVEVERSGEHDQRDSGVHARHRLLSHSLLRLHLNIPFLCGEQGFRD